MKIVSACLVGCKCRYDNQSALHSKVENLVQSRQAVPVCPEQFGGLPTPRNPAEIVGGDGFDVLDGNAKVIDSEGNDVTQEFIDGAYRALNVAQTIGATTAILKKNSPSCGSDLIYDGSFSGMKKEGVGVTVALLLRNGLTVTSEDGD
ncbi:uncharacterized protein YbbK (DUF523 family) [Alicyclobacillus sacchari]|uniref:Uncharacterized protein YbbK (DUF523 family) n=4 Tax=Alicyclobacillus TaxID=29330 RepID=A0A4R8LJA5_9BACL|nr:MULTISPECIES: DUF523 domain-containing protein [Alicyclobacillus]MDQ0188250.1 uncharacterized protein YbbK (DUF523 family) [Alicyclobacillus cycloheptanicus]TDY42340.1 uncharacterized protein YbbK (DUF523 family) [Alicyclobacillus sacchari]WAH35879.1 DUF523 domain-containing protein [Alicyclobacillus dauci]WDM00974.1 DUF523 domain-containing protein [Alicyclobacillus cycloheptanicus]GMA58016.1 purine-nucleoside phosphorylase [Alicyclobacillus sacchari]